MRRILCGTSTDVVGRRPDPVGRTESWGSFLGCTACDQLEDKPWVVDHIDLGLEHQLPGVAGRLAAPMLRRASA